MLRCHGKEKDAGAAWAECWPNSASNGAMVALAEPDAGAGDVASIGGVVFFTTLSNIFIHCTLLQELCDECFKQFHVLKIAVSHRSGTVVVGEPSVIIATSSAHRLAAIEACHWLIDKIKETVPIWKKEFYADGQVWKANAEAMPTPAQECAASSVRN